MKRPYRRVFLLMLGIIIYCLIQCMLYFPEWIIITIIAVLELIFVLYLASKDGGIIDYDLGSDILVFLFWLSLILTYPIILYSAWKDREIIRAKIREEIHSEKVKKFDDPEKAIKWLKE